MFGINFDALPLALNGALFVAGAVVVWIAGTKLALYADALAERTGIGRAFLGMVLLAGVTELPECVTSISAVWVGDAPLAVNNLFGGIVMQTAILAIADMFLNHDSLSYFTPKPELLLQGILLVVLLAIVLAGVSVGEVFVVAGVGAWTLSIFVLYLFAIWMVAHFEAGKSWRPVDLPDSLKSGDGIERGAKHETQSPKRLWMALCLIGFLILVSGSLLAATSAAIATQTGLGSSFIGATLLAATTSLPELSTTLGAVKLRAYSMAFGNIFGSNAIMLALLFLTDIVHTDGPILAMVDRSAAFAAAVGIAVTGIYLVGLVMRRQVTVFRMGIDSFAVLILYLVSLVGLYVLRGG